MTFYLSSMTNKEFHRIQLCNFFGFATFESRKNIFRTTCIQHCLCTNFQHHAFNLKIFSKFITSSFNEYIIIGDLDWNFEIIYTIRTCLKIYRVWCSQKYQIAHPHFQLVGRQLNLWRLSSFDNCQRLNCQDPGKDSRLVKEHF